MNAPNGTCSLVGKGCFTDGKCYYIGNCKYRVITNADRIRAMSDEELAKKIPCPYIKNEYDECKFGWHERTQTCEECALEWLRMPASN